MECSGKQGQPSMMDSVILNHAQTCTDITTSASEKQLGSTGYVLLSRLNAIEKREQLNEWEDIEIDGNGNAILRSMKSDVPDGQCFLVEHIIQMPKESVGGPFMVITPRGKVAKEEKVEVVDEKVLKRDGEFVVV